MKVSVDPNALVSDPARSMFSDADADSVRVSAHCAVACPDDVPFDSVDSSEISITAPEIAENGAVVPVGVVCNIPNTQEIYIFVEKNPNPLAAVFKMGADTAAQVNSRLKMGQSTNIIVVAKADGKLYSAMRETKVTLGGCGG